VTDLGAARASRSEIRDISEIRLARRGETRPRTGETRARAGDSRATFHVESKVFAYRGRMGGQVLGGGVIVLVAVALWLVYLLPSWHSRHQYTSAERNAVRLNQALRVLAETSETPGEVRLELNARTALQQQKLARRAQAQQEQAELAVAKARLEVAKRQSALERDAARVERAAALETARAARAAAIETARAERAASVEAAHAERRAARATPAARRARARRRFRLAATALAAAGVVAVGAGAWQIVATGSGMLLGAGSAILLVAGLTLHRLGRVARRAVVAAAPAPVVAPAPALQDVVIGAPARPAWTPRELPRPLVSSAGSRASAVLDEQAAREALRAAAREEAVRDLARKQEPPSIDTARHARQAEYDRMGYVDDAEIEDHVRRLLARRAVGA
jgi:hypothetical protein